MSENDNELDEHLEDTAMMEENKIVDLLGIHLGNLLIKHGYVSTVEILEADDSEILDILGVGQSSLDLIRTKIGGVFRSEDSEVPGVSDQPATTESEVKPVSIEADPAESEIAEPDSAEDASVYATPPIGGVTTIRSLWPGRLKVTVPSGTVYQWEDSGSQVNVAMEDVKFVMEKNRNAGRACCGGSGKRIYFELT